MYDSSPLGNLDDGMKIQAICIDLDIPSEADFYMLLHDFITKHDPEGTLGIALFDQQNIHYAESRLEYISGGPLAKKMQSYARNIGHEWNIKQPAVQLSYMFSDPEYKKSKYEKYKTEILPKIQEYDWYDVFEAMEKADDLEDKETEELEDMLDEDN